VKVISFFMKSGQVLKRILTPHQLDDLTATLEAGFKSRKSTIILTGDDVGGNVYFVRLEEVNAISIDDFDLKDL